MKRIVVFLIVFPIVFLSSLTFAQTYNDFAREIFFGRLPRAKTEAMGRILVLNFDPYFVSQSNPANLVFSNGISLFYSQSSPFYGYTEASYNYAGISYVHPLYGGIAFNFLSFNSGSEVFGLPFQNPIIEKKYLYTLTYSYKIQEWFAIGINANLFVADFGIDKTFSSSFFELGFTREFTAVHNSTVRDKITVGTQLKNIFSQSFSAIDEAQADAFPKIFRIGLSNSIEYTDNGIYDKSYLIGFLLGLEYQDLFNSNKRTAYKAGAELSVIDLILLRGGYYHETTFSSIEELNEFTYGFGLKLDFDRHFTSKFPLVLLFDFVSLKQPSYTVDFYDWDNFTTFTLIANYRLD